MELEQAPKVIGVTDEKEAAYHEAGHVAIILFLKSKFKYVTIIPNEEIESLGSVHGTFIGGGSMGCRMKDGSMGKTMKKWYNRYVMINLGGGLAQAKRNGIESLDNFWEKYALNWSRDLEDIEKMAISLDPNISIDDIKFPIGDVLEILDLPNVWFFVDKLVDLLLKEKTLSYSQCKWWYDRIVHSKYKKRTSMVNVELSRV